MTARALVPFAILAALAIGAMPHDAHAKKKDKTEQAADLPEIEECGIQAFDDLFGKVKDIHDTLDGASEGIQAANARIVDATGAAEGASLDSALGQLMDRANGAISVKMEGGKPSLAPSDAVPSEVKTAISEINAAVGDLATTTATLATLPAQVKALIDEAKTFPGKLNPALIKESGLKATDLLKVAKTVKNNIKTTTATPDRIKALTNEINSTFSTLQNVASAGQGGGGVAAGPASSDSSGGGAVGGSSSGLAELEGLMSDAQILFEDAETEDAALLLNRAQEQLPLQTEVVPTELLLRLYRLQAAVWIADGDDNNANRAVARAVAAAPDEAPPSSYGPELRTRHEEHAEAMALRTATVKIKGDGQVWVDGRSVGEDGLEVVVGDHLVQAENPEGLSSEQQYISANTKIQAEAGGLAAADPLNQDPDDYSDLDEPVKKTRAPKAKKERSGGGVQAGWLIAGGATTLAGGGLLALSYYNEQTFLGSEYSGSFGGEDPGDEDWEDEREDQIKADATFIRGTYFAGYGLVGLGLVGTTIGLLASPTWDGHTMGLQVSGNW